MDGPYQALSQLLSDFGEVIDCQVVGGGCISEAFQVTVDPSGSPPRSLFAKRNRDDFIDNFRCEADGLRQLAQLQAIHIPEPFLCEVADGEAWLVTEWIEQGAGRTGRAEQGSYFERFGRQLAAMHEKSRGRAIGLDRDNYLGAAKQLNAPADSWAEFFAQRRLAFQIGWATDQGLAARDLRRQVEQIIERLPHLLEGRDDETSLLHGDLWSGNYLSDAEGRPVIIDPAIYRGCREAEFGMLQLFGGCPSQFYEAYQERWPMADGWQQRVNIYVLYHLLNHLNLFGAGYASQCDTLARQILRRS